MDTAIKQAGVTFVIALTLLMMLLTTPPVKAEGNFTDDFTYSIGASQSRLHYDWYGASQATFKFNAKVLRVEAEHDNGFAMRLGYGLPIDSSTQTDISGSTYRIKFDRYAEFELIYKYQILDHLKIYAGWGYYFQTVPIYKPYEEVLIHYDEDNDNGMFAGVEVSLGDSVSFEVFIKNTSVIGDGGDCDKVCLENREAKGSLISQVGVGLLYRF